MDFFFEGHWRMDWWLGNPNKTAVLIASLMIASWSLAFVRKWGFWMALILNAVLGVCLMQTYSRGGIVATGAGLALLAVFSPRPWPRKRVVVLIMAVGLLLAVSLWTGALRRCSQSMVRKDPSITNRLEIWQAAARMILDASSGWGIGQSGQAYMQWYQPVDRDEPYRTLVNSHLTWLVEFSWVGRIAYLAGWGTVILLCWPAQRHRWFCVPLAIWTAFGVGAFFSSVAESPWLWIVPAIALLAVLGTRLFSREWPRGRAWGWVAGWTAAAVVLILVLGWSEGPVKIHRAPGRVDIEPCAYSEFNGKWFTLVAPDPGILGERYGQAVRTLALQKNWCVAIEDEVKKNGDSGLIILVGDACHKLPDGPVTVRILNPKGKPPAIGPMPSNQVAVYWGELFQSGFRAQWEEWVRQHGFAFHQVDGAGEYLARWTDLIGL